MPLDNGHFISGFVNLLSNKLKVDERKVHYWLDTYYQLRLAYEKSEHSDNSNISGKGIDVPRKINVKISDEDSIDNENYEAIFKMKVRNEIVELRQNGTLTTQELINLSCGEIESYDIYRIVNGEKVSFTVYEKVRKAIDKYYAEKQ